MTKELVNTAIINGLKSKGIFIGGISPEVLNAFSNIMHEALAIPVVIVPFFCNNDNESVRCREQCNGCEGNEIVN